MPSICSKLLPRRNTLPILLAVFKRHGHARIMTRTENEQSWKVVKDHMHFYLLLGLLTWGGAQLVVQTLFGPCQLVDTPENYEPHVWEYEQTPMKQLCARYLKPHPIAEYESRLAMMDNWARNQVWRKEEHRARRLMFERQDYKSWYYIPYSAKWIEWSNWQQNEVKRGQPWFLDNSTV